MTGAARRELKSWLSADAASLSEPANWTIAAQLSAPDLTVSAKDWAYGGPVASAIRRLSPAQQSLLTRRYVHDATLEQIAVESSTSTPAVSQRLATAHRAVIAAMTA
jgi:DNA-directed RNA polymerase specialized sigma24 family protein